MPTQMLPSESIPILRETEFGTGILKSSNLPVAGSMRPIWLSAFSTNQTLPSPEMAMPYGLADFPAATPAGTSQTLNSLVLGSRRMIWLASSEHNQTLPSG